MDFKVFLSREALSDLERLVAYIASHDPVAADRFGNRLPTPRSPSTRTLNAVAWFPNFDDPMCAKLSSARIASSIA